MFTPTNMWRDYKSANLLFFSHILLILTSRCSFRIVYIYVIQFNMGFNSTFPILETCIFFILSVFVNIIWFYHHGWLLYSDFSFSCMGCIFYAKHLQCHESSVSYNRRNNGEICQSGKTEKAEMWRWEWKELECSDKANENEL